MPNRRDILFDGALALLWTSLPFRGGAEAATRKHAHSGCMLTGEEAAAFFGAATEQRVFAHGDEPMFAHSGNRDFDVALAHTLAMISDQFGVLPGFAYFDDSDGMNAYATPETRLQRADGTVLFGTRLLKILLGLPEHPEAAVSSVCAHEFGHIVQHKRGLIPTLLEGEATVKRMELHADFLAGYFAGLRKREKPDYPAATFALTEYGVGDFKTRSPGHHGTPDERGAAIVRGFQVAFKEKRGLDEAIGIGVNYVKTV